LDVKRGGEELGGAAGRVEVCQEAVEAGERELGMKAEEAVGFGVGMFVGEVLAVVADQEKMKEAFVDLFELFDAAVGFGMGDVEAEGGGGGCLGLAGEDIEVEAVFEGIGERRDEVHAAAGAAAG
jgi:hypothetical protein